MARSAIMARRSLTYFTPDQLTGLTLWLKADSITASDGDALSTWSDSSGNGNDATNSGAAGTKPAYKLTYTNGKPAVTFDGGDGFTVANESSFDIETPTVFIVATRTSGTGVITGKSTTGFTDGRRRKLQFHLTATQLVASSGADGTSIGTTVTSTSVPAIYSFASASNTSHKINYNGTNTDSTTTLSESSANFNNAALLIGSNFAIGTEGFVGDVAEIILFNRALNDSEILGVMNYLASKYNITNDVLGGYPRTAVSNRFVVRDFGTCIRFVGGTDFVEFGNPLAISAMGTSSFTACAWIKTDLLKGTRKGILNWGKGGTGANQSAYLFINTSNFLEFDLASDAGPVGTRDITDGIWHFTCVVNNAGTVNLYLDGVVHGSTDTMSPNTVSGGFRCGRGLNSDASAYPYAGLIDEPRIYTRALSATEIQNLYYGIEPPTTNLRGLWKFDEGSGTTANDSSGNSVTGTLTNSPAYSTNVVRKARTAI